MDKFACSVIFTKEDSETEIQDYTLVSSIYRQGDYIDFEYDILFKEEEEIQSLGDGEYYAYMDGYTEFESDVDWESGIDEGHFVFYIDNIFVHSIKNNSPVELKSLIKKEDK